MRQRDGAAGEQQERHWEQTQAAAWKELEELIARILKQDLFLIKLLLFSSFPLLHVFEGHTRAAVDEHHRLRPANDDAVESPLPEPFPHQFSPRVSLVCTQMSGCLHP